MTSLNWQESQKKSRSTSRSKAAAPASLPQAPQRSSGLQWMAVSFGLMGIIVGFSFHSFGGSVQAQSAGNPPSVAAPSIQQAAVIRPPDPNAPQGGGCGRGV